MPLDLFKRFVHVFIVAVVAVSNYMLKANFFSTGLSKYFKFAW